LPLITEDTEREIQSWFKSFASAFAAMAFGGTAGLAALRAVNIGRTTTRATRQEIGLGSALTPLEQSFVAGKLAGAVGVTPVRKMTANQLRRGLDATGVSTLTTKDRMALEALRRQNAQAMVNRLARWESQLAAAVHNANVRWAGALEAGEVPLSGIGRREAARRALAGLAEEMKDLTTQAGAGMNQLTQTSMAQSFQQGQAQNASPNDIVYKIPRMTAEKHCMRLHLNSDGTYRRYVYRLVAGNTNIGRKPPDWVFTIGPVHPHCYCILRFERKQKEPGAQEPVPGPNKALADQREKTLGGTRFRADPRRSQAGRRREARVTGRRGRRFGEDVEPELGETFQPRARGLGSIVRPQPPRGTVAATTLGLSADGEAMSTWETGRGWWDPQLPEEVHDGCCGNRPSGVPPEEYEMLLQAARDFYGEDSPTR
jgi:hypothetical protein